MSLRYTVLSFSLVLCLAACGGDDPAASSDAGADITVSTDSVAGDADQAEVTGSEPQVCMTSAECVEGEVCTTEFGDGSSCGEGQGGPMTCGECVPDPCASKTCGDTCECPEGGDCGDTPWTCNPDGGCVPTPTNFTCPEPPVPTCEVDGECGEGEICTTSFGDCVSCGDGIGTGAGDVACCGTCQANPCNGLDCGDYCDCPSGVPCTEIARACNSDGHCVTAMGDLGCEEPEPYDPCADVPCGSNCFPCAPDDEECQAQSSAMLERWCDADGQCTDNEGNGPPVCEATSCMSSADCGGGEACTTDFFDCVTCEGGDAAVCCGTCVPNPCAGLACGDGCACPPDMECPEVPWACNSGGQCVTASNVEACEEPEPYDPCADMPCGSSCNPCAPDDQDCQEMPMLEHWCNADGSCTDNVDNEPPLCEATCMSSADCGGGEACTTDFFDCVTCEGSAAAVCCGTCVANPCAGLACGDGCVCPPDTECPEVPWACNSGGQCVTANNVGSCEEPPGLCDDQPCGTACGDDQICDNDGACIVSPNMPADEFCAAQAAQCMSSDDCEVGEACSVLYDDCQPCVGSEMLTVCCGTCETFAPCTGLACGDSCSTCPPDQPECPLPMTEAEWYCQDDGTCDDSVPPCTD